MHPACLSSVGVPSQASLHPFLSHLWLQLPWWLYSLSFGMVKASQWSWAPTNPAHSSLYSRKNKKKKTHTLVLFCFWLLFFLASIFMSWFRHAACYKATPGSQLLTVMITFVAIGLWIISELFHFHLLHVVPHHCSSLLRPSLWMFSKYSTHLLTLTHLLSTLPAAHTKLWQSVMGGVWQWQAMKQPSYYRTSK